MTNRQRGEVEAVIDGRRYTLCLTLGALAELEAALGAEDLVGLVQRLSTGRLRAIDAVRLIGAGLRGGGHDIDNAAVAAMRFDGAAAGIASLVTELIAATFGAPSDPAPRQEEPAADE